MTQPGFPSEQLLGLFKSLFVQMTNQDLKPRIEISDNPHDVCYRIQSALHYNERTRWYHDLPQAINAWNQGEYPYATKDSNYV